MKHIKLNGVCVRHCPACAAKRDQAKLKVQRLAMSGYHPEDYPPETLTDDTVRQGALDGDTLAQFIWRETADAKGDVEEAARMINNAVEELTAVAAKLMAHCKSFRV